MDKKGLILTSKTHSQITVAKRWSSFPVKDLLAIPVDISDIAIIYSLRAESSCPSEPLERSIVAQAATALRREGESKHR